MDCPWRSNISVETEREAGDAALVGLVMGRRAEIIRIILFVVVYCSFNGPKWCEKCRGGNTQEHKKLETTNHNKNVMKSESHVYLLFPLGSSSQHQRTFACPDGTGAYVID